MNTLSSYTHPWRLDVRIPADNGLYDIHSTKRSARAFDGE